MTYQLKLWFRVLLLFSMAVPLQAETTQLRQILNKFDHKQHEPAWSQQGKDCGFCHAFVVDRAAKRIEISAEQAGRFTKPVKDLCHSCHQSSASDVTTPIKTSLQRCDLCHANASELKPESHRLDWQRRHAAMVLRPQECQSCHATSFCTDCHQRFETSRPKQHPRYYQIMHSIEARLNPAACASCHRLNSCQDCHLRREPLR